MEDESEIILEQLIFKAVSGDKKALEVVIAHWWTIQLLSAVSKWAERKYRENHDDIRQVVHLALFLKITTLQNKRKKTWRNCVRSFCFKVAKNYSLGVIDHDNVVASHAELERSAHEAESITGSASVLQSANTPTPEQLFQKQERLSAVEVAISKVLKIYPQDEEILNLWLEDPHIGRIAEALEKSPKTIYPRLRRVQKALCRELGIPLPKQRKRDAA
jgi:DNA-directed RNA polymerase specialized sigma24 family protein